MDAGLEEKFMELFRRSRIRATLCKVRGTGSFKEALFHLETEAELSEKRMTALRNEMESFLGYRPWLEMGRENLVVTLRRDKIKTLAYPDKSPRVSRYVELPMLLGRNRFNRRVVMDLAMLPHLLVLGEKGSGRTNLLSAIIKSISDIRKEKVTFLLSSLSQKPLYRACNRFFHDVITSADELCLLLEELSDELEKRKALLSLKKYEDITSYNEKEEEQMGYIIAVIDDLDAEEEEHYISCLLSLLEKMAGEGGKVGIHFLLSTSTISGAWEKLATLCPDIAVFKTRNLSESLAIFDSDIATTLYSKGEFLFKFGGIRYPVRLQSFKLEEGLLL